MTVAAIAECAGCKRAQAQKAVHKLMQDYAERDGALEIVETPSGYSLQLRQGLQHLMQNLVPAELGIGALRTLVVIALKGPLVH
jgi:segregation and condensation protein B